MVRPFIVLVLLFGYLHGLFGCCEKQKYLSFQRIKDLYFFYDKIFLGIPIKTINASIGIKVIKNYKRTAIGGTILENSYSSYPESPYTSGTWLIYAKTPDTPFVEMCLCSSKNIYFNDFRWRLQDESLEALEKSMQLQTNLFLELQYLEELRQVHAKIDELFDHKSRDLGFFIRIEMLITGVIFICTIWLLLVLNLSEIILKKYYPAFREM